MSMEIKPLESKIKNTIKIPPQQEQNRIPKFGDGSSILLVGGTGSGKTTLLLRLVKEKQFYGDFFKPENRYLFSETAGLDDLSQELNIPKKNIFDDSDDLVIIKYLDNFIVNRKNRIKKSQTLIPTLLIFEDFSSRVKILKSKAFKFLFTAGRHLGVMSIVITHKITALPPMCRNNCLYWFMFKNNNVEVERLADEMCPSVCSKKEFMAKVKKHTSEKHSFISIFGNCDEEQRFRKNLTHTIDMSNNPPKATKNITQQNY
jgi:hypothetical protein